MTHQKIASLEKGGGEEELEWSVVVEDMQGREDALLFSFRTGRRRPRVCQEDKYEEADAECFVQWSCIIYYVNDMQK